MKRVQRVITLLLILMLLISMSVITQAATIMDSADVAGSDFTESTKMAKLLDNIFLGDIDIYSNSSCTSEVYMPIGKAMSMDTQYWVKSKTTGNKTTGWQCYIYANAVYNKLFNEWVGHGGSFSHSETVISPGTKTISYTQFNSAGVRCGAYMRTTGNSSGSFSGDVGHSLIILAYDATNITYLEGNGDGKGMVRISIKTWSDFNRDLLTNKSRCISHVVQPTNEYYDSLYPVCDHKYNDSGYCKNTGCGIEYDYLSSLNTEEAGYYKVTTSSGITLRTGPYQARSTTGSKIAYGTQLRVIGSVENHFYNKWYQIEVNGTIGYTYESHLTLVKYLDQSITGTITDPVAGERIPQGKHPVAGTITSHNYHLEEVKAYLDGRCYATVTLENTNTLDVRSTDINAKLSFGSLSLGEHTLVIKARDKHHTSFSTVCSVTFTTICGTHSYTSKVTKPATCATTGIRTYTCTKCGNSYTETIAATGNHSYGGWITVTAASCTTNGVQHNSCTVCGITQTQSIAATGHSYGQWSTLTPGNCTTGEVQKTYCVYCGAMETQILPAVGHSYGGWTTVAEATCTAAGTQQKVCSACGDTQYQAIPAIGYHSYGGWVTVTAPTCTGNGTQQATCSVCGDVQTQTIAAIGHIPGSQWGYDENSHWHNCTICGGTLEAGRHQYEGDICEICGYSRVIPGDLNDDGSVDNADVAYLLWYTLFPEDYPLNQDPDFNGDGSIDNADVAYLLWHTLFPADYPL